MKRGRRIAAVSMAAILTAGMGSAVLPQAFAEGPEGMQTVYAEEVSDKVSFSASKSGKNIVLKLSGKLTQNSWWYTQKNIKVTYSDGSSGEIEYIIQPNSKTATARYNWGSEHAGKVEKADSESREFSASVSVPVSALASEEFTLRFEDTEISSSSLGFGKSESSDSGEKSGKENESGKSSEKDSGSESREKESEETDEKKSGDSSDDQKKTGDSGDKENDSLKEQKEEQKSETENKDSGSSEKLTADTDGRITVDGSLDDWEKVKEQASTDSEISSWKAARDEDGNLYICFTGAASTQWYGNYNWKYLKLTQNGKDTGFQIANTENSTGGRLSTANTANGNTAGSYYVEMKIPAAYLKDNAFTLNFAGTTVKASELPVLNGKDVTEPEDNTYKGIVIDGKFKDWNAVTKYDASCPNSAHPNCLSKAAMVFDGDTVYIYVKDGKGSTAANAGSHSNGNFVIRTDLGRQALLHFHTDGTVTSDDISGIKSEHVGDQWEISLPASQLPYYQKTISFGLYSVDESDPEEMFVKDVANLNGSGGNVDSFNGIVYDGNYDDWNSYPHTVIEYATAGTQEERADGEAALYSSNGKIFGHVYSTMPAHLNEKGGEFANAVTIRLNQKDDLQFYPRLVSVDSAGNINWNPSYSRDGTYEYYIVDTNGWGSAKTLEDLNSGKYGNAVYGKMTMTINGGDKDECEFYLDMKTLAEKFNLDASDLQYVQARFGRIGQQWVGTAGASSGPWLGVGICVGAVAAVWIFRRKKKGEKVLPEGR